MYPYDPSWVVSFDRQAAVIDEALQPWLIGTVEHIGSTAVPGLVSKPIIDMLAVADISCAPAATQLLEGLGWISAPEPTDEVLRKLSFCTPSVERRTHHLHVVEQSSSGWRGWLAFRDVLRLRPDLVTEYGELKSRLADSHGADPNQRDAYRAGKAGWISRVTEGALRLDRRAP